MDFSDRKLRLNNGSRIPIIGLGTGMSANNKLTQAIKDAIDIGYRHFDCAPLYQNETEVGAGIKSKLGEGVIKRDNIFVTSKLWGTCHRPDLVGPALRKTLTDLGLEYLDLYLMHFPMALREGDDPYPMENRKDRDPNTDFIEDLKTGKVIPSNVDFVDTWKAMEKLVTKGLTKSIGVSNFNSVQLTKLLSHCNIEPVLNQVELHPYLNQTKLVEFCKSRNINITAYSPFGSPARPWAAPHDPNMLGDPVIKKIASELRKSPAQIIIRWITQLGVTVIPKSVTKERLVQNCNVFNFDLPPDAMEALKGLNKNWRAADALLNAFKNHPEYPFLIEF